MEAGMGLWKRLTFLSGICLLLIGSAILIGWPTLFLAFVHFLPFPDTIPSHKESSFAHFSQFALMATWFMIFGTAILVMSKRTTEEPRLPFSGLFGLISAAKASAVWKQTEEALQHSEGRLRGVLNTVGEGLVLLNRDGEILLYNTCAAIILGCPSEELSAFPLLASRRMAIREDGSDFPFEEYPADLALRQGLALRNIVMGLSQSDGGVKWLSINCTPLVHIGETRPHCVVVTFADITAEKRAWDQVEVYMLQNSRTRMQLEMQKADLEAANAKLEALATMDGLTGITNHRAFQERLEQEFQRAKRYKSQLSVICWTWIDSSSSMTLLVILRVTRFLSR